MDGDKVDPAFGGSRDALPSYHTVGAGRSGTVTGVPAAEGEVVEVIVIRGSHDAERYACAPVAPGEFSDAEDALGWDGEGWDEFAHEAR